MTVKIDGKEYETTIINDVQRFKTNSVIRYLVDSKQVDLNRLSADYQEGEFTKKDYMEFVMMLGYSVSGLLDLEHFNDVEIYNPLWESER